MPYLAPVALAVQLLEFDTITIVSSLRAVKV